MFNPAHFFKKKTESKDEIVKTMIMINEMMIMIHTSTIIIIIMMILLLLLPLIITIIIFSVLVLNPSINFLIMTQVWTLTSYSDMTSIWAKLLLAVTSCSPLVKLDGLLNSHLHRRVNYCHFQLDHEVIYVLNVN